MNLAELLAFAEERCESYADVVVLLSDFSVERRFGYKLGAESFGKSYGWPRYSWRLHDCSGKIGAILRVAHDVGQSRQWEGRALWSVGVWGWRPTARKFHYMSRPLRPDETPQVGDIVTEQRRYFRRDGSLRYERAPHHVILVTGEVDGVMMTSEARRGTERHPLSDVLARRWATGVRRIPELDLGEATIKRTLWPGDESEEVEWLQERLNAWLGPFLTVTGRYDSPTKNAVRLLQKIAPSEPPPAVEDLPLLVNHTKDPEVMRAKSLAQALGHCKNLNASNPNYGPLSAAAFGKMQLAVKLSPTRQVDVPTWTFLLTALKKTLGLSQRHGVMGVEEWSTLEREPDYPEIVYRDGTRGGRRNVALGRLIAKVGKANMRRLGSTRSKTYSWTFWHYDENELAKIQLANGLEPTKRIDKCTWSVLLSPRSKSM